MDPHHTHLLGLGTALPELQLSADDTTRFLARVAEHRGLPPTFAARIARLVAASGVHTRYSVLSDYGRSAAGELELFPKTWSLEPQPGTAARMAVYEREVVPLAARAAHRALSAAKLSGRHVTHLVLTSCTGFYAPGPDVQLARALELSPDVARTVVGFMGCYAGLAGMRVADSLVRADPAAVVLEVAVELSTLHFRFDAELRTLLPSLLFADGAAAAVWAAEPRGLATFRGSASRIAPDSDNAMTWRIGDQGFEMFLDADVPEALEAAVPSFTGALLAKAGLRREEVAHWLIHPGGRRIVELVGRALSLGPGELAPSLETLAAVGNVSSATIFFVLERALAAGARGPAALLAFGPGLALEGSVLDLGR